MILAVDNEKQIKNLRIFENKSPFYKEHLIKQFANNMAEEHTDLNANSILNASDVIYIYGMSIGSTDALWWQRIITLMNSKQSLHIIIQAYDAPERTRTSIKYKLYEEAFINKFLEYGDITDDDIISNLKGRIHLERV